MNCPSCGADSDITIGCSERAQCVRDNQACSQIQQQSTDLLMNPAVEAADRNARKSSTLIEFPGVVRPSVPEWRKQLSERVREVQERRAREAAQEAEAVQLQEESGGPQLELLPHAEMPAMNPLVAAALKRIERAHQTNPTEQTGARPLVVAYAPALEQEITPDPIAETEIELETVPESIEIDEEPAPVFECIDEKPHGLVVVAPQPPARVEVPASPKRLILDDLNDPALNYLDSISKNHCIDELGQGHAARFRRMICAALDFIVCAILSVPIALAIKLTGNSLYDRRAIIVVVVSFVVVTFIYQTLTIALTGRTWAMRLLSLRIIDRKTGLIPTGRQAAGRAFLYILSVAAAGLGILFALISREGRTVHDQFTRTEAVRT